MKTPILIISIIAALALIVGAGLYMGLVVGGKEVKLAIPVMGAYKCEEIQDKFGLILNVPKNGFVLTKDNVGFYTNGIQNIKLSFSNSYWSTDWATRAGYAVCDKYGTNCGAMSYITDWTGGHHDLPIASVNFETQTLQLVYQRIPFYLVGGWQNSEGLQATYDATAFGLKIISSADNPGGRVICSTSCDVNCPDIGVRKNMQLSPDDIIGFYDSVPYFERWDTVDYDLNQQGGATVYDSATNKFCFAGTIYTGKTVEMVSGDTYIYPDVNTRQTKLCCPGATIVTTNSKKLCKSDYTWEVITDKTKVTCFSDINCPGQGGNICQSKRLSGYTCESKDANNVGVCVLHNGNTVACCNNNDCNNDMTCDTSTHTCKGGNPHTCGDGTLDAGEQCDDGNTVSGDGCSSICKLELACNTDANCKADEQCLDHKCVKKPDTCEATCAAMSALDPMKYVCEVKCSIIAWLQGAIIWIAVGIGGVIIVAALIIGIAIAVSNSGKKGRRR